MDQHQQPAVARNGARGGTFCVVAMSVASALLFLMVLAPQAFADEATYTFSITAPTGNSVSSAAALLASASTGGDTGTLTLALSGGSINCTINMPTGFTLQASGFSVVPSITGVGSNDPIASGTLGVSGIQYVVTASGTSVSFTITSTSGFTSVDQLPSWALQWLDSSGDMGVTTIDAPEEPATLDNLLGVGVVLLGVVLKSGGIGKLLTRCLLH